jgi:hypothetical protein
MKMVFIIFKATVRAMPNFDGTGPRGLGRRKGRGRGVYRRDGDGSGAGLAGRTGGRWSDLLWLVREAVSIWGAVKALRGIKPHPRLSVSERDLLEQNAKRRLQRAAGPDNGREALDMQDPPRLIEYRRPVGR